jgi:thiamine pyrophosphate-dependent acetolactate synthase large subunit-like protein
MRVPAAEVSIMSELENALQHMFETQGPCLLDVHITDGFNPQPALDKERAATNS